MIKTPATFNLFPHKLNIVTVHGGMAWVSLMCGFADKGSSDKAMRHYLKQYEPVFVVLRDRA